MILFSFLIPAGILAGTWLQPGKPPIQKLMMQVTRCGRTTVLPLGSSLLLDIRSSVFRAMAYPVQLRDPEGRLVSTGTAVGHADFIEVQLPEIEQSGTYWLQIFDKGEEVLEAPIQAQGTRPGGMLNRVEARIESGLPGCTLFLRILYDDHQL